MKAETTPTLEKLRKEIHTPIASLKLLKIPIEHLSDIRIFIASICFNDNTAKDWQKYLGDSTLPPTIEQLDKFIVSRMTYLEALENKINMSSTTQTSSKINSIPNSYQTLNQAEQSKKSEQCPACKGYHLIC